MEFYQCSGLAFSGSGLAIFEYCSISSFTDTSGDFTAESLLSCCCFKDFSQLPSSLLLLGGSPLPCSCSTLIVSMFAMVVRVRTVWTYLNSFSYYPIFHSGNFQIGGNVFNNEVGDETLAPEYFFLRYERMHALMSFMSCVSLSASANTSF